MLRKGESYTHKIKKENLCEKIHIAAAFFAAIVGRFAYQRWSEGKLFQESDHSQVRESIIISFTNS